MFCVTFSFFNKPPKQRIMTPRKPRARRDSFGLELREDGTLACGISMDSSSSVVAEPTTGNYQRSGSSSGGSQTRPQLCHAGSESRKSIVTLMKTRRRKDSFGLEVRDDGTLSLDRLSGGEELRIAGVARSTQQGGNTGNERRASLGDRVLLRAGTQTRRNSLRRRDSFGLELRPDGTLSFDRLVDVRSVASQPRRDNSRDEDRGHSDQQHSSGPGEAIDGAQAQCRSAPQSTIIPQQTPVNPSHQNRRSPSQHQTHLSTPNPPNSPTIPTSAGTTAAVDPQRGYQAGTRNRRGRNRVNSIEVEILRERVRILEVALAERAQPPANHTEQPPAYQSRPSSPAGGQRVANATSGPGR